MKRTSGYSFLLFLFLQLNVNAPVYGAINVNQTTGRDSVDCWRGILPCLTLGFALEGAQYNDSSEIFLSEGMYNLHNNKSTMFINKTGFVVNGETEIDNVIILCDKGAGLSFVNSSNIIFKNVKFIGCGFLHNSTSINVTSITTHMNYLKFRAAIYLLFCCNVSFESVSVANSIGTGIVLYSTYGLVSISSSNFTNNSAISGNPGGGGVAVEFVYCAPGDTNCSATRGSNIPIPNDESIATYLFTNCHFSYNEGTISSSSGDSFVIPHANHNVALGRGAGLTLLFKGNSSNNTMSVIDCKFEGNSAVWGGAMLIEFQDDAHDNKVYVNSTVIANNSCYYNACTFEGTGGGGVRIQFAGFKETVRNNIVHFVGTHFINNKAYFGGGASFFTFPIANHKQLNMILFETCTWYGNIARLGSAIDLSLWNLNSQSLVTKSVFNNCTFDSNSNNYTEYTGVPVGVGTLYTDSVPIVFEGTTTFRNNAGSGVASLDSTVEFGFNSNADFMNNTAEKGAGIILFNKGFIKLGEQSHLRFINNTASFYGGAIYWEAVGDHQLITSQNCFIRYENSVNILPSQWKTKIEFNNNKATLSGHAIFATTLLGCLWYGQALIDPVEQNQQVFCWNSSIWDYGSGNCTNTSNSIIATAPGYYANKFNEIKCSLTEFNFDVVPGKPFAMDVYTLDDRLNRLPLNSIVFALNIKNHYINSTKFITNEHISYEGNPSNVAEMSLSTLQPRIISTKVNLSFEKCPPGYVISSSIGKCQQGNYTFVRYDNNFLASIQFGYWIGNISEIGNDWYVIQCPYCTNNPLYSNAHFNYIPLPAKADGLDDFFCSALNRTGIFCSDCVDGYGVAVNSDQYKCIHCPPSHTSYSWLIYLIFEYGPVTVMLIFVIIFNVSVTSGPANAFIFFAQVISTTFGVDAGGIINYQSISPIASDFRQFYRAIYGIWNLNFFTSIYLNDGWLFCLGANFNILNVIMLKYITALYPLLVLVIIIILVHLYDNNYRVVVYLFRPIHKISARCLRKLNLQRSLMDSFATFLIFSYVKFAVVSCTLLYPCPLEKSDGEIVEYVSYFNGNLKYNSREYVPYLMSSLIVIILCILLPFILLLYSIKPCYSCLDRYSCHRLQPGVKLQHFLNSFHHCFKDGVNGERDCRYFAAVYFYFKLAFISAWALGIDWTKQYLMQQAVCTIALFMLGIVQPYKKMLYNILDLGLFSLFSIINILTLFNKDLQANNRPLSKTSFYITATLILVPFVYFVGYNALYIYKTTIQGCCRRKNKPNICNRTDLSENSFSSFMADVDAENRLERNNYYGSIQDNDDDYVNVLIEPEIEMKSILNIQQNDEERSVKNRLRSSTEPVLPRSTL